MSRLTEALERAGGALASTTVSPVTSAAPTPPSDELPEDWHFEADASTSAGETEAVQEAPTPLPRVADAPADRGPVETPPPARRTVPPEPVRPPSAVVPPPQRREPTSTVQAAAPVTVRGARTPSPVAPPVAPTPAASPAAPTSAAPPTVTVSSPKVRPAALPTFGGDKTGKIVLGPQANRAIVEQYRRLAALLHHSQAKQQTRVVMIASAVASEGKTLTATNLALTLSHSYQRRVLLIDADLRRPSLHRMFDIRDDKGLSASLRGATDGKLSLSQVLPNLWVVPAGLPNPDPMSSLVSSTMQEILSDAAGQFDWVILDTPPVGLMPDANLLASMIDAAFLVVSAGTTPWPMARKAIDAIGPSRLLGVVLNRAERSKFDGYDEYYAYYGGEPDAKPEKPRRFGIR